jgi:hypothetical protein
MAEKKQRKKVEQRINKFKIAPPNPHLTPTEKWYNVINAAKRLRISTNTLYRRCRQKLIIFYMNGNAYEFNEADMIDYEQRCKRNTYGATVAACITFAI